MHIRAQTSLTKEILQDRIRTIEKQMANYSLLKGFSEKLEGTIDKKQET